MRSMFDWITGRHLRGKRYARIADFRRFVAVIVCVALFLSVATAGPGRAPVTTSSPACNPAQCRAKAAFAFEQLAAESKCEKVAPAPKAKACPCGPDCECAAGVCPLCPEAPAAVPAAPKSVAYYREVWRTDARGQRVRELVPVFGDTPVLPASGCANGKCPLR